MNKMNMRKIRDATEQLKDENNSIEKRHRPSYVAIVQFQQHTN